MVEQDGGIVEQHGTVWWNRVEWYGGTVWNGMVKQWNSMVEQWKSGTVWKSVVEERNRGTVWWNSVSSVGQCGGTLEWCW